MVKIFKIIVSILIFVVGLTTIYLSYLKFQLRPKSIMIDSFAFASKNGDTLQINYSLEESDIKDIIFLTHGYSTEYGGEGFSISNIKSGESAFGRKFNIQDSSLIYKNYVIKIGESFEDTLVYKSKRNLFKIEKDRLVIKNEGFVKAASMGDMLQKRILFKTPILMISGNSYYSYSINTRTMFIYKTLPYVLIAFGFLYLILYYLTKRGKSTATNSKIPASRGFPLR